MISRLIYQEHWPGQGGFKSTGFIKVQKGTEGLGCVVYFDDT